MYIEDIIDKEGKTMEIQWKHVFLAFAIILLLINLPLIFNALSEIISGFSAVTTNAFKESLGTHPVKEFQTFALVKFLVLMMFFVGILWLVKNWGKK
jgi:hypothetical protein